MIKLGIIGCGAMGQNHVRASSEISDCKLEGIFDMNKAICKRVAMRYGTNRYSDVKKLLSAVDAVTIVTPTVTHYKVAKQALEAGKHVLLEKPICSDAVNAEKLCKLAEESGLTFSVGHIERHNPVVAFAKEALSNGTHGSILSLSGKRVGSPVVNRVRDIGVILDLGIHEIDNCRYLTGSDVEFVGAFGGSHTHNFEDYITLTLSMANGSCANIEINWLTPMKIRKLDITCSKSFINLDYINQQATISSAQHQEYDPANLFNTAWEYNTRIIPLKKQEPLKLEIKDFLDAINHQRAPLVTGADGLAALKVAKAAIKAYQERRIIDVRNL